MHSAGWSSTKYFIQRVKLFSITSPEVRTDASCSDVIVNASTDPANLYPMESWSAESQNKTWYWEQLRMYASSARGRHILHESLLELVFCANTAQMVVHA